MKIHSSLELGKKVQGSNMKDVLTEDLEIISKDEGMKSMSGNTILVTGATGLIGSLFIKAVLLFNKKSREKIRMIAVIRDFEKARRIFGESFTDSELFWVQSDLKDLVDVEFDVDYVIHTASVTTSKLFVTNPVETIETMYRGTKNILELAKKKKCKSVVYLSSMEMYGIPDATLDKVRENDLGYIDILNVRSSYSEGKRIAECLCAAYYEEYGVPVKIARLAQTFGAGILPQDNRVYAQFARSVLEKRDIILHTEGKSYGNYCYTTDVIQALILLLHRGENGQAYNVCNEDTTTTIANMARMVIQEFGDESIKVVFDIPENQKLYGYAPDVKMCLCSEKLRELGWKAQYTLAQMYERMIGDMLYNQCEK